MPIVLPSIWKESFFTLGSGGDLISQKVTNLEVQGEGHEHSRLPSKHKILSKYF